jgi:hypothetical protein
MPLHQPKRWHPAIGMSLLFVAFATLAFAVLAWVLYPEFNTSRLSYLIPGLLAVVCVGAGAWALSGPTTRPSPKDA